MPACVRAGLDVRRALERSVGLWTSARPRPAAAHCSSTVAFLLFEMGGRLFVRYDWFPSRRLVALRTQLLPRHEASCASRSSSESSQPFYADTYSASSTGHLNEPLFGMAQP
jgi:hypothetical protein